MPRIAVTEFQDVSPTGVVASVDGEAVWVLSYDPNDPVLLAVIGGQRLGTALAALAPAEREHFIIRRDGETVMRVVFSGEESADYFEGV